MISRVQTILFAILLVACLVMAGLLWRTRERAHRELLAGNDVAPTKAPVVAAPEKATLLVANDNDNSLREQEYSLPLPGDPGARARALLNKLLELYAAPDSPHPIGNGAGAVEQVFLLPAIPNPGSAAAAGNPPPQQSASAGGPELAVVNLKGSFAASHPSGLETESLTVLSICGTLRANLPRVTQVRFLVDGEMRQSLAGHADLTQTYLTSDASPAELNRQ
ncbi:MAG: GerMN domain-containing protein [Acidobacteriota bacterium]